MKLFIWYVDYGVIAIYAKSIDMARKLYYSENYPNNPEDDDFRINDTEPSIITDEPYIVSQIQ